MPLQISVVVPTCRRPELLDRCLAALVCQDLCPSRYEVIVVDDAQCPRTREVVAKWSSRSLSPVRYLLSPGRGPASARNAGWKAAEGEIVAFTDDDCVPSPGWLEAGLSAFSDGVVGAHGSLVMPLSPSPTDYERNAAWLANATFVTANCFYTRDVIERVGGFDERFTAAWREDSDLRFRIESLGRLIEAPCATVLHPVRPAAWGVSLRQQKKSQFNALLYKKHPLLYRERIQETPPWRYYWITSLLLSTLLLVVLGSGRQAAITSGGWAALTGAFCLERLRGTSHAPEHVAEMVVTSALIPPLAIFWRLVGGWKFKVWFL